MRSIFSMLLGLIATTSLCCALGLWGTNVTLLSKPSNTYTTQVNDTVEKLQNNQPVDEDIAEQLNTQGVDIEELQNSSNIEKEKIQNLLNVDQIGTTYDKVREFSQKTVIYSTILFLVTFVLWTFSSKQKELPLKFSSGITLISGITYIVVGICGKWFYDVINNIDAINVSSKNFTTLFIGGLTLTILAILGLFTGSNWEKLREKQYTQKMRKTRMQKHNLDDTINNHNYN